MQQLGQAVSGDGALIGDDLREKFSGDGHATASSKAHNMGLIMRQADGIANG
jgi:hypothetical protein